MDTLSTQLRLLLAPPSFQVSFSKLIYCWLVYFLNKSVLLTGQEETEEL